jgi:hypothetical protein
MWKPQRLITLWACTGIALTLPIVHGKDLTKTLSATRISYGAPDAKGFTTTKVKPPSIQERRFAILFSLALGTATTLVMLQKS